MKMHKRREIIKIILPKPEIGEFYDYFSHFGLAREARWINSQYIPVNPAAGPANALLRPFVLLGRYFLVIRIVSLPLHAYKIMP
jgi:hypothetical protein